LPNLALGGAERVMLTLAENFSLKGYHVEIIVLNLDGSYLKSVPKNIEVINLSSSRALFSLFSILKYLKSHKPDVMLSALGHINILAIIAKIFSRVKFRLVISEHAIQSLLAKNSHKLREKIIPFFMWLLYRFSDHVIAVSNGVAESVLDTSSISPNKITTIYNPIIYEHQIQHHNEVNINSNFNNSNFKIIAVGRLSPEKDYYTLLKAFEVIKKSYNAHLLILGEGDERSKIESFIRSLNLTNYVTLLGFVEIPSAYIYKCDVLCLSSISEGFGNVIVEALAVGVPVVSTNCPSGPSEILKGGLWGELVQVGDFLSMSRAIIKVINGKVVTPPINELIDLYGVENNTNSYLKVLTSKTEAPKNN